MMWGNGQVIKKRGIASSVQASGKAMAGVSRLGWKGVRPVVVRESQYSFFHSFRCSFVHSFSDSLSRVIASLRCQPQKLARGVNSANGQHHLAPLSCAKCLLLPPFLSFILLSFHSVFFSLSFRVLFALFQKEDEKGKMRRCSWWCGTQMMRESSERRERERGWQSMMRRKKGKWKRRRSTFSLTTDYIVNNSSHSFQL